MSVPAIAPVCSVPRDLPECSLGVREACKETAIEMKPEKNPFSKRSDNSCHGDVTMPISAVTMAIPNPARSSMILRPRRSAMAPHSGWVKKDVMN
ncbi:hypothetical protein D3C84_845410 [compost metagenome]